MGFGGPWRVLACSWDLGVLGGPWWGGVWDLGVLRGKLGGIWGDLRVLGGKMGGLGGNWGV